MLGVLFAFLSAFLFAVSSVFIKKGMRISSDDNGVITTVIINAIVSTLFFIIYRMLFNPQIEFNWTGLLFFVLAGCLTTFIGRFFFFVGIRKIGPSAAAAIKNSAPMFTVIFAVSILHENVSLISWIGIIFIMIGIFTQGLKVIGKSQKAKKNGFMIVILAAVSFGVGQGLRKQGLLYFSDPFAGAFIGALVALISFMIMSIIQKNFVETIKSGIQKNTFYLLGGIAISFATLSFFIGIWFTKVAYVGTIVAAEPILTVIISRLFLKEEESIDRFVIFAAIFVFSGATLIAVTA